MQVQTSIVREKNNPEKIRTILLQLTEIPDSGIVNIFARDAHVYEILKFMNSPEKAETYQFQVHHFNLKSVFGKIITTFFLQSEFHLEPLQFQQKRINTIKYHRINLYNMVLQFGIRRQPVISVRGEELLFQQ